MATNPTSTGGGGSNPTAISAPMPDLGFGIPSARTVYLTSVMALTFASVAVVWTAGRLWIRRKSYWWDDLCAGLACLSLMCQVTLVVVNNEKGFSAPGEEITYKEFLNYFNSVTFPLQDWFARTAILYSVIRITPSHATRKFLHWIVPIFWACCLVNIFLFVGHCERHPQWKYTFFPLCVLPKSIPIFQMVTGILADTLLIVLPIHTLRMLKSAPHMRRRLMAIFASSVLLTIATIVQCVLTFKEPGMKTLQSGLAEGFVAVMVCSLAVIAIAVMKLLGFYKGPDSSGPSVKPSTEPMKFLPNSRTNMESGGKRYTINDITDSDTEFASTHKDLDTVLGPGGHGRRSEEESGDSSPNNDGADTGRAHRRSDWPMVTPPTEQHHGFLSRWRSLNSEEADQVRTWA